MIEDSQNNTVFGTRKGAIIILSPSGTIKKFQVTTSNIINFAELKPGVYLTCDRYFLTCLDTKTGKTSIVKQFSQKKTKIQFARVKRLKNNKVIISIAEGIYEITTDLKLNKIVDYDEKHGFYTEIFNVYEDKESDIWVPTRKGILKFNSKFELDKANIYFKEYNVLSLIKDTEKNIWLATSRGLIKVYSEGAFYFSTRDGLVNDHVQQLVDDGSNGIVTINYEGYVNRLLQDRIYTVEGRSFIELVSPKQITRVGKNDLLIMNDHGTKVFNPVNKSIKNMAINGYLLQTVLPTNDTIFFTDHQGAGYFKNNKPVYYYKTDMYGFYYDRVEKDPEGNLLAGGKNGLALITKQGQLINLAETDAVCQQSVFQLTASPAGTIWAVTLNYLYAVKNRKIKQLNLDFLPANTRVKNITLCGDTAIWIATNSGAYQLLISNMDAPVILAHFNTSNALISNDVNNVLLKNGNLYFATSKGISVISPLYRPKKLLFPVLVRQVKLGNTAFASFATGAPGVSYQNNTFQVNYECAGYSWGNINYKYKLHPIDKEWESTPFKEIKYQSLPPGKYTFSIKAMSESGIESSQIQTFNFTIYKPYWQTLWFWALAMLLLVLVVLIVIRYRDKKINYTASLQKGFVEAQLKALRLQMNPHFIFNTLQSIQDYIITHKNSLAVTYLSKFSRLVRNTLDYSAYELITLKEELTMLDLYTELEKARFDGRLEYVKQVEENLRADEIMIPPMLIQPFLENAIKHGIGPRLEGCIHLSVKKDDNFLFIVIKDDGIGRAAAACVVKYENQHNSKGIAL
jgi:two-component sensor histidine kinase